MKPGFRSNIPTNGQPAAQPTSNVRSKYWPPAQPAASSIDFDQLLVVPATGIGEAE